MDETWRAVVEHDSFYEVSDAGRIRTLGRSGAYRGRWGVAQMNFPAREMRVSRTAAGYCYVCLRLPNQTGVKYLLHRLVMRAFVGEPSNEQPQVNHKDGNKSNNAVSNLEYVSSRENLLHCTRVLGKKRGSNCGSSKLTEDQARAILIDTRILREIAVDYGISLQAVWAIRSGRTWSHVR